MAKINSKYRVRQFVKKFLAFCGKIAFITVLTTTRRFVLSGSRQIQSTLE